MSDLPAKIHIHEEGPREGIQIEKRNLTVAQKANFIEALAETGVRQIDCVSFMNPKRVPNMADADEVARAIRRNDGVRYTGLWLNTRGLERALELPLDVVGSIRMTASETFSVRNTNKTIAETEIEQRRWLDIYRANGIAVEWGYVMTAFGCSFEGAVPIRNVLDMVQKILDLGRHALLAFLVRSHRARLGRDPHVHDRRADLLGHGCEIGQHGHCIGGCGLDRGTRERRHQPTIIDGRRPGSGHRHRNTQCASRDQRGDQGFQNRTTPIVVLFALHDSPPRAL